ncbi:MAG: hypothetical protein R3Y43_05500 [Alphaproteobacteria bacterium]
MVDKIQENQGAVKIPEELKNLYVVKACANVFAEKQYSEQDAELLEGMIDAYLLFKGQNDVDLDIDVSSKIHFPTDKSTSELKDDFSELSLFLPEVVTAEQLEILSDRSTLVAENAKNNRIIARIPDYKTAEVEEQEKQIKKLIRQANKEVSTKKENASNQKKEDAKKVTTEQLHFLLDKISDFQAKKDIKLKIRDKILKKEPNIDKIALIQRTDSEFKKFSKDEISDKITDKRSSFSSPVYELSLRTEDEKNVFLDFRPQRGKAISVKLTVSRKGKALTYYLPGIGEDADSLKKFKAIYNALESGICKVSNVAEAKSSTLSSTPRIKKEISLKSIEKDYNSVYQTLSQKEHEALEEEIKAYNQFIDLGNSASANELKGLINEKYTRIQNIKTKKDLTNIVAENSSAIENKQKEFISILKQNLKSISSKEIISLVAPATEQNKEKNAKRPAFNKLLSIMCSSEGVVDLRSKVISGITKDGSMWTELKTTFKDTIKILSQNLVVPDEKSEKKSREILKDLYAGNITSDVARGLLLPGEIIKGSEELSNEVFTRAIETYCLQEKNIEPEQFNRMNELLEPFGKKVRLEEYKVEEVQQAKPAFLTESLRALASSRPVDINCGKFSKGDKAKFATQHMLLKQILGDAPNFDAMVSIPLERCGIDVKKIAECPYEKQNKILGLYAGISDKLNAVELAKEFDKLFLGAEEHYGPKDLPKAIEKKDDYLFSLYVDFMGGEKVDLQDKDKLKSLKDKYNWSKFKKDNMQNANALVEDIMKGNKDGEVGTYKLIVQMAKEGKMQCKKEVHHIRPLKYSIGSKDPLRYNDSENLVVIVQWKPYQVDNHALEHSTTVEGSRIQNGAYLVKAQDGKYVRKDKGELKVGDILCYEKLQVKNAKKEMEDFLTRGTIYVSSLGTKIPLPTFPEPQRSNTKEFKNGKSDERL